jgi:hypothetical protein
MSFQIITIAIVLGIFALFAYGAACAEKVVAAKAKENREAMQAKTASKTAVPKATASKQNKKVVK